MSSRVTNKSDTLKLNNIRDTPGYIGVVSRKTIYVVSRSLVLELSLLLIHLLESDIKPLFTLARQTRRHNGKTTSGMADHASPNMACPLTHRYHTVSGCVSNPDKLGRTNEKRYSAIQVATSPAPCMTACLTFESSTTRNRHPSQ